MPVNVVEELTKIASSAFHEVEDLVEIISCLQALIVVRIYHGVNYNLLYLALLLVNNAITKNFVLLSFFQVLLVISRSFLILKYPIRFFFIL